MQGRGLLDVRGDEEPDSFLLDLSSSAEDGFTSSIVKTGEPIGRLDQPVDHGGAACLVCGVHHSQLTTPGQAAANAHGVPIKFPRSSVP